MKKYFSGKLYLEGLKKLRVVGILGIILASAASLISCVTDVEKASVQNFSVALLPLLIFAPAMVISVFSFLNKRKSSDFYHSMPVSRTCMFSSFFLAAYTWTAAAVLICWSLCAAVAVPLGKLPVDVICILLPAYLCACLLLSGIAALAVSATGTSFAAATVFLFSAFTPILILDLFIRMLSVSVPSFVAEESFLSVLFFDNSMIGELFSFYGGSESLLWSLRLYILTLIVALLFIGAALYVYKRRGSEWATRSAPSARLRTVYRCLATLPIGIGCTFYALYRLEKYPEIGLSDSAFTTIPILALILSVFVWFLLELLFTKQFRLALASFIKFYLIPGGCALFILSVAAGKSILLNFNPTPSDVHSFAVNYSRSSSVSYEAQYLSDVFVADDDLEQLICDSLAQTNQNIKNGADQVKGPVAVVHIKLKSGIVIARKLTLQDITVPELMYQCALSDEEFMEKYLKLPIDPTYAEYRWFGDCFDSDNSGVTASSIWNVFATEYSTLSTEQKLEIKRSDYSSSEKDCMPYISAGFNNIGIFSTMDVYVPEYMTNTRQYFFYLVKRNMKYNSTGILDELYKFNANGYTDEYGVKQDPYILTGGEAVIALNGEVLFSGKLPITDNVKMMRFFNAADGFVYKDAMAERYPLADGSYLALCLQWEQPKYAPLHCIVAVTVDEETARILCDILQNDN